MLGVLGLQKSTLSPLLRLERLIIEALLTTKALDLKCTAAKGRRKEYHTISTHTRYVPE
jgi:hypothetical protein